MLFPRGRYLGICGDDICLPGKYEYVVWHLPEGWEEGGVFPLGGLNKGEPRPQEEEEK